MKFAEIPKFILNDFLNNLFPIVPIEPSAGSRLSIPGHIITASRELMFYGIVEVIDEDENTAFIEIPFSPAGDDFYDGENTFYLQREIDSETIATSAIDIPQEASLYILRRKGGVVQEYLTSLVENGPSDFINTIPMSYFVNINKPRLYLGKLYNRGNNIYSLDYWGYDRYAVSCLPEHNQTPKLKEFFNITLDRVYNSLYNQARDLQTLLDPHEVNLDYILYIAQIYNIEYDRNYYQSLFLDRFDTETRRKERRFRSIVSNIINLLKRKGTYSSLYAIYKSLFNPIENNLSVYERWHSNDVLDFPTSATSAAPFDLEPYFIDINYLSNYGASLSGCTSGDYYNTLETTGISVPLSGSYIFRQQIPSESWKIYHNLNIEMPILQFFDLDLNQIVPTSVDIVNNYLVVASFSEPKTGISLITTPEIHEENSIYGLFQNQTQWPDGWWVNSWWNDNILGFMFNHNLNVIAPIIRGYKSSAFTYEDVNIPILQEISSNTIIPSGTNSLYIVDNDIVEDVSILAIKGDYVHSQYITDDNWTIEHNLNAKAILSDFYVNLADKYWILTHSLNTKDLLIQAYRNDAVCIDYDSGILKSNYIAELSFSEEVSGKAFLKTAFETINLPTGVSWTATHSTGAYCPLILPLLDNYTVVKFNDIVIEPSADNETLSVSASEVSEINLELALPEYIHSQEYEDITWLIKHNLDSLEIITTAYITTSKLIHTYYHNLGTTGLLVQFYNDSGVRVAPLSTSITTTSVTATFSSPFKGRISITTAVTADLNDFNFYVAKSGTTWNVEHYLDRYDILCKFYTTGMVEITPTSFQIMDNNWITATFSSSQTGYACIKFADMSYKNVSVIEAPVTIIDKDNISVTWPEAKAGYLSIAKADIMSAFVNKISPITVNIQDENTLIAEFDKEYTGLAVIKEIGQLSYNEGLAMTPHYKAEIDLTCSPLNSPDILNEDYARFLNDQWDMVRPACKYAHYSLLFSPLVNFLGEDYKTALYSPENIGNIYTYCSVDASVFPASGGFVHATGVDTLVWEIEHNLNSEDVIIQCFDVDRKLLFPSSVKIIDANNVRVEFDIPTTGICFIIKADDHLSNVISASIDWNWNYSITPSTSAVIADHYFYLDKEQILPSNIQIIPVDTLNSIWYVPTLGYAKIRKGDYLFVQSLEAFEWVINHNLEHRGVIVKIYDLDWNEILPENIQLAKGENKITITFPSGLYTSGVSGYAVLTMVGGLYTPASIIAGIAGGGYLKIGNGTSTDDYAANIYNDLQSPLDTPYNYVPEISEDGSKYYIKAKNIGYRNDGAVTEFGLFTKDDDLVFYSFVKGGQFYKMTNFDFTLYYIVNKFL